MLNKQSQLILYSNNTIIQFFRYSIVGGIASVIDISVFTLLAVTFDFDHLVSNSAAFLCGLIINYLLCKKWVFSNSHSTNYIDFFPFAAIGIVGILISNLILYFLIDIEILAKILFFASEDLIILVAKLTAVFIVLFWNFIARKKIVFSKKLFKVYDK